MAYCRIDELDASEEALLEELYNDAVSQLEDAGITKPADGTPRRYKYNQCIKAIVLDSYDNRGSTSASQISDNPAFRKRIMQLKLTEPDSISGSDTATEG